MRELLEGIAAPKDSCCCGPGTATVRWYTRDGDVAREIAGAGVQAQLGYVTSNTDSGEVFFGMEPFWKLSGLRHGVYSGTIGVSGSGRVLAHQVYPDSDHVAVDIYHDGVLRNTIGPFASGRDALGTRFHLDPSGAFALVVSSASHARPRVAVRASRPGDPGTGGDVIVMPAPTSNDAASDSVTVVVVNDDGRETFRFRTTHAGNYQAAPDGSRVVYEENGNNMTSLDGAGREVPLGHFPGSFVFWGPDAATFVAGRYHDNSSWFSRVDCRTGKNVWEIRQSSRGSGWLSMETLGNILLIGESPDDRPTIRAVEWASGKSLGIWRASELAEHARLMSVGGRVYFVTDEYFSEIEPSTIGRPEYDWETE